MSAVTLVLVGAGAVVVLGALVMMWALCAMSARSGEVAEREWQREAESLAELARERARNEMAERVHRLIKEGRR